MHDSSSGKAKLSPVAKLSISDVMNEPYKALQQQMHKIPLCRPRARACFNCPSCATVQHPEFIHGRASDWTATPIGVGEAVMRPKLTAERQLLLK